MTEFSTSMHRTNEYVSNNYICGQLYCTRKWYVRPLNWVGLWKLEDDKRYLISGNIERQFDTEQECIEYIKNIGGKDESR